MACRGGDLFRIRISPIRFPLLFEAIMMEPVIEKLYLLQATYLNFERGFLVVIRANLIFYNSVIDYTF